MMPLGLLSWLSMGLVAGLLGRALLPGRPQLGLAAALTAGAGGAVVGGLLATALGFGGLAGFDLRALVTATLASIACLLVLRATWLPS